MPVSPLLLLVFKLFSICTLSWRFLTATAVQICLFSFPAPSFFFFFVSSDGQLLLLYFFVLFYFFVFSLVVEVLCSTQRSGGSRDRHYSGSTVTDSLSVTVDYFHGSHPVMGWMTVSETQICCNGRYLGLDVNITL